MNNYYFRIYGLTNRTLSITKISNSKKDSSYNILQNNKIYDFFLFNKTGICILHQQFEHLFTDKEQYNNYKLIIKNIAHKFELNQDKNKLMIQIQIQNNDKLNINTNKVNPQENEFIFNSIQNNKIKILFLLKNNIIMIGTFPITSSIQFQRLLLLHTFIALINFKGDFVQFAQKLNKFQDFDENNFKDLKNFYAENAKEDNQISKEVNNMLEILIFQNFFLKTLILHFLNVFNEMFKKEDLNLKQTKLSSLYILDISSSSVILDMSKIQGLKNSKKNRKFYKFENLFEELIYHSKNMYNQYINENEMKYNSYDLDFRFVKFECTSTYPRLLFIIKFIPVLKGISVIHIYRQKKLSRNNENNMLLEQGLNFKEVDLLFGSFIRDNPNFEFKYGAPKKLENIEKFLEEFYVAGRNGLGIFRLANSDKKYLYVNYDIINIINDFHIVDNLNVDKIFEEISKKIEENYEKEQKSINKEDIESNLEESKDSKKLNNILTLSKEKYYKLFLNKEISKNSSTINSPKGNYKKIKKINISINISDAISKGQKNSINKLIGVNGNDKNNRNISQLIDNNSERKNLIKSSETLSLFNTKTEKNSRNINLDNFSSVSKVKTNEKFEIKIINLKESNNKENEEDKKEDTKEKITDNSPKNEKEMKLNDLLDIMSSNKKINYYINDKNKIEEDFEENELTKRNIDSMKLERNSIASNKRKSKISSVSNEKRQNWENSKNSKNSLVNNS